jgi:hypothetical protein
MPGNALSFRVFGVFRGFSRFFLAALAKSLGAFFTDPNRSLRRLAPVSHDERMNRFQ